MTGRKKAATAIAHPNIAFIKYWGNINNDLRLAANDSISMNLGALETRTTVEFMEDNSIESDKLTINGAEIQGKALERVSDFIDIVRKEYQLNLPAIISSSTNFPIGAGIASSASAFAALAIAVSEAAGLSLSEAELSRYARRGSGSASRSIPTGFVEWYAGNSDETSFASSFAPQDHWNLVDCIAVINEEHKPVGSTSGHGLAWSSPLQQARVNDTSRRFEMCKQSILARDFESFAEIVEMDSNMMHAVMMTSTPSLFYWAPTSLQLMKLIPEWRRQGIPACYTLDAGANVHILTTADYAQQVEEKAKEITGVKSIIQSHTGGAAHCVPA